jgi:hypothetical protein
VGLGASSRKCGDADTMRLCKSCADEPKLINETLLNSVSKCEAPVFQIPNLHKAIDFSGYFFEHSDKNELLI